MAQACMAASGTGFVHNVTADGCSRINSTHIQPNAAKQHIREQMNEPKQTVKETQDLIKAKKMEYSSLAK